MLIQTDSLTVGGAPALITVGLQLHPVQQFNRFFFSFNPLWWDQGEGMDGNQVLSNAPLSSDPRSHR